MKKLIASLRGFGEFLQRPIFVIEFTLPWDVVYSIIIGGTLWLLLWALNAKLR